MTSSTVSLSVTIAYEVLLVWLHDVVTGVLFDGPCAPEPRIVAFLSTLSPPCMTFLMDFLGIVSKQIVARLVELEVVLRRAFHVQNVDRVVVRPEVFVSLVLIVRVFVQGVDEGEVNCLPSFCVDQSCLVRALCSLMAFSYFAKLVELCRTAHLEDLLREDIRLNSWTRISLDCPSAQV